MLNVNIVSALWNFALLLFLAALVGFAKGEWWGAWQLAFGATLSLIYPVAALISPVEVVAGLALIVACAWITALTATLARPPWIKLSPWPEL